MQTTQKPVITGGRQLSESDIALVNEAKDLGEQLGQFVRKLRANGASHIDGSIVFKEGGESSTDWRWIDIGEQQLQLGIMALVRSVAQPTGF